MGEADEEVANEIERMQEEYICNNMVRASISRDYGSEKKKNEL